MLKKMMALVMVFVLIIGTTVSVSADSLISESNRGGYTDFLGWYEIKTITVRTNYLDDTMVQSERYNVKLDLKIEDFKRIVPGTLYEDVLGILGKAHEYKGCGKVAEVYKTSDGYRVAIYYSNKAVDQIRVLYDDETYDIIVQ